MNFKTFNVSEIKIKQSLWFSLEINKSTTVFKSALHMKKVPHYKNFVIWIDDKFTFQTHKDDLRHKLNFLYRNRSCFYFLVEMKVVLMDSTAERK